MPSNIEKQRNVLLNALYDIFLDYAAEQISYEEFIEKGNKELSKYEDSVHVPGAPMQVRNQKAVLLNELPITNSTLKNVELMVKPLGINYSYVKKFHVDAKDSPEINFINLDDKNPDIDF